MTLNELWAAFRLERSISVSPTSLSTDYQQVGSWLARCPHQELTQGRLAIIWVLQQSPEKSARRVAHYLKTLYRWACSEDVALVAKNPLVSFKLPKKPQLAVAPTVIPTALVTDVLWALEQGSPNEAKWHLLANFMLQTGLRTAEAFGLHWGDIDWEAKRVLIHQNMTLTHGLLPRTKTGKARWVPLNATAIKTLKAVGKLHGDDLVFPWKRESFMTAFRSCMERLVRSKVITIRYRPYDLRHTNISHLLEKGIPVTQVANWSGNTPAMIWQHYANTTGAYEMPDL